ncbi:MAG: hypothetical protein JWP88_657 [Flaviaesturariibacter sp.]|nr:hypothetical protein [Flaviaesturariibacter sp.]
MPYFYTVIREHLLLGLLWVLFCVFHSVLADINLKSWIATKAPNVYRFYRLLYTLFALGTFLYIVSFQIDLRSPFLLSGTFMWIGYPVAGAGLVIMAICIKKYFISLSGLKSLATFQPNTHDLKVEGVHRYVRHPLYLGTFIFIWGLFLIIPQASLLISNVIIHVYTLIGIRFEEQKLLTTFGKQYEDYRLSVPKIIPALRVKRQPSA